MGMKQILVMMVLVGQFVMADEKLITDPIVEESVREELNKPTGELTEADLRKAEVLWYKTLLPFPPLSNAGLKEVAKLHQLRRLLTTLQLINNQITDAGLKEVAKMQQLTKLYLTKTQITDAGLKEVAKLQKLEVLILANTKITDEGLKEVAKLKQLKTLILSNTQTTDAGVAKLKKAFPNYCYIEGP